MSAAQTTPAENAPTLLEREVVALAELRPHPRNYRAHPPEQLRHLVASIREHGVYRNVVVAVDGTILAGRGVYDAALEAGLDALPVVRLPIGPDDPKALKLLVADNEIARLGVVDDVELSALLATIRADDVAGLVGTGFDDDALATLLRIIDARGEPIDPAAAWDGMPPFEQGDRQSVFHTTVHFASEDDATAFFELIGIGRRTSLWWPEHDGLVGSDAGSAWVAADA